MLDAATCGSGIARSRVTALRDTYSTNQWLFRTTLSRKCNLLVISTRWPYCKTVIDRVESQVVGRTLGLTVNGWPNASDTQTQLITSLSHVRPTLCRILDGVTGTPNVYNILCSTYCNIVAHMLRDVGWCHRETRRVKHVRNSLVI